MGNKNNDAPVKILRGMLQMVFDDRTLSKSEKLIMLCVISHWNDKDRYARPSQRLISEETGLSYDWTRQLIGKLCVAGKLKRGKLIDVDPSWKGDRRQCYYKLCVVGNTYLSNNEKECVVGLQTMCCGQHKNLQRTTNTEKRPASAAIEKTSIVALPDSSFNENEDIHSAIKAYQAATYIYPRKVLWEDIAKAVGEGVDALKLWYDVCHEWVGRGWNPENIQGMLEAFQAGGISKRETALEGNLRRLGQVEEKSFAERYKGYDGVEEYE